MYRLTRPLFFLALALTLAACSSLSRTNVSGNWGGKLSGPGGETPFTLSLTQSSETVGGTMTVYLSNAQGTLPVNGYVSGSALSLTAREAGGILQLTGAVTSNNMTGSMVINSGGRTGHLNFVAAR